MREHLGVAGRQGARFEPSRVVPGTDFWGGRDDESGVIGTYQDQIYKAIMGDAAGKPTWTLLRASRCVKNNRLLPRGWSADHPDAGFTRAVGVGADSNFTAGGDVVRYQVDASGNGPFRIEAELLYEVVGVRFVEELFTRTTPEIVRFRKLYTATSRSPVRVAVAHAEVP